MTQESFLYFKKSFFCEVQLKMLVWDDSWPSGACWMIPEHGLVVFISPRHEQDIIQDTNIGGGGWWQRCGGRHICPLDSRDDGSKISATGGPAFHAPIRYMTQSKRQLKLYGCLSNNSYEMHISISNGKNYYEAQRSDHMRLINYDWFNLSVLVCQHTYSASIIHNYAGNSNIVTVT